MAMTGIRSLPLWWLLLLQLTQWRLFDAFRLSHSPLTSTSRTIATTSINQRRSFLSTPTPISPSSSSSTTGGGSVESSSRRYIFHWPPISFPGTGTGSSSGSSGTGSASIGQAPPPLHPSTSTTTDQAPKKWSPELIEHYRRHGKQCSVIDVTSLALNTRKISAVLTVDSSMQCLWDVLTDYNHLSSIVPNLVQSYLIAQPRSTIPSLHHHHHHHQGVSSAKGSSPSEEVKKQWIYQEGAQKVMGFDFKAGLTLEMKPVQSHEGQHHHHEAPHHADHNHHQSHLLTQPHPHHQHPHHQQSNEWKLSFKCINSLVFDMFDGEWRLQPLPSTTGKSHSDKVHLSYDVTLKPKGPFPVIAVECRIKDDIPVNLYALKLEAEGRHKKLLHEKH